MSLGVLCEKKVGGFAARLAYSSLFDVGMHLLGGEQDGLTLLARSGRARETDDVRDDLDIDDFFGGLGHDLHS